LGGHKTPQKDGSKNGHGDEPHGIRDSAHPSLSELECQGIEEETEQQQYHRRIGILKGQTETAWLDQFQPSVFWVAIGPEILAVRAELFPLP
jgi:hypothetical protein